MKSKKKDSSKSKLSEKDIKLRFLYEDLRRRKFDTQGRFLFQTTVVITVLIIVLSSTLLLFSPSDRKDIFLFPFSAKSNNTEDIKTLEEENLQLQKNVQKLQNDLDKFKNQPSSSKDISVINAKLDSFSSSLNALNTTILEEPDTAITSRLIREKQTFLDQKLDDLLKDQQRLEDKVDGFLSNLIAVPVFAALAALVFTIIAAIATPVLTKAKDKLFGSSDKNALEE